MKFTESLDGMLWNGEELKHGKEIVYFGLENGDVQYSDLKETPKSLYNGKNVNGCPPAKGIALLNGNVWFARETWENKWALLQNTKLGDHTSFDESQFYSMFGHENKIYYSTNQGTSVFEPKTRQTTKINDEVSTSFGVFNNELISSGPNGTYKINPREFISGVHFQTMANIGDKLYGTNLHGYVEVINHEIDRKGFLEISKSAKLFSANNLLYFYIDNEVYCNPKILLPILDLPKKITSALAVPISTHYSILNELDEVRS